MPDELILALDQSTSGSKAMVVDKKGKILSSIRKAHKQYYPRPGWVEHDPDEIWASVNNTKQTVLEKIPSCSI